MYPAEIPILRCPKVPFPSNYYQFESPSSPETDGTKLAHHLALEKKSPKYIALVPMTEEDGKSDEFFTVGVIARVIQVSTSRKNVKLWVRGIVRCKVTVIIQETPFYKGRIEVMNEEEPSEDTQKAFRTLLEEYIRGFSISSNFSARLLDLISSAPVSTLADSLCGANYNFTYKEQLKLLSSSTTERMQLLAAHMRKGNTSNSTAIVATTPPAAKESKKPSVGASAENDDMEKLKKRLYQAGIPQGEAWDSILRDYNRLTRLPKQSSEYDLVRSYLEFSADLPWNKSTTDNISLSAARKQLDDDHCGLDLIKRRIVEYLAVLKLRKDMKGPILCFIGPPGTGKSSLGQSVADALGRKFLRIALGGVRDESVIRGHRRTYVGALPGRILDGLKKVGVNNPVILLDEIDKMGVDTRGDPASALLEVLDPVQNHAFTDHYLGVPFDLSKCLFIATGNSSKIPAALKDRMEVIEVPGYSFDEKIAIAKQHLLPKQLEAHGMGKESVVITDDALLQLVRSYTNESGVRSFNRLIGAVVRYIAASVVREGEAETNLGYEGLKNTVTTVTTSQLAEILGPTKYEEDTRDRLSRCGVATGLGYTGTGSGSILYIESTLIPTSASRGKITLTGQLGDVMRESCITSLSWIRANTRIWQHNRPNNNNNTSGVAAVLDGNDVHVHFPAGAVAKDGPSAGVAITVALVSLLSARKVRDDSAMTGEMSLTGLVLPVGGIKEKVLAAHRNGIKRVYLPKSNMKDLHDVPEKVKQQMTFIPVSVIEEVLETVFADEEPRAKL